MRITRDEMFMRIAHIVAERGTCPRAKVGAVLVDRRNNICSIGYNGAQPGRDHCEDVGCYMHEGHCVRTVHAEANAIDRGVHQVLGKLPLTLYVTHKPCQECTWRILNNSAAIRRVVYDIPYRYDGPNSFTEGGVIFERYQGPTV